MSTLTLGGSEGVSTLTLGKAFGEREVDGLWEEARWRRTWHEANLGGTWPSGKSARSLVLGVLAASLIFHGTEVLALEIMVLLGPNEVT